MSNVSELCPFCKSIARSGFLKSCDCCAKTNGFVECTRCGCQVSHYDTEEEAIAVWNNRSPPAADIGRFLQVFEALDSFSATQYMLRGQSALDPAKLPDPATQRVIAWLKTLLRPGG